MRYRRPITIITLALCSTVESSLPVRGIPQEPGKTSAPPSPFQPRYFPERGSGESLIGAILFYFGEPSLFEASKDPSVRSFRLTIFSPVPTHRIAIRLTIAPDGTGQIVSIIGGDSASGVKRMERTVTATEVEKFLALVEKADFWSMNSSEPYPSTDEKGRRVYVMDPSAWMLEGVQGGSYHGAFRWNPKRNGAYAELARYLAKDLGKLDAFKI